MTAAKRPTQPLQKTEWGLDANSIRQRILYHLNHTIAKDTSMATKRDWFNATAYTLRDYLAIRWTTTIQQYRQEDTKRVYYLSLEFLIGKMLVKNLLDLGIYNECCQALSGLGISIEEITELEPEPALGNGGLGRLAACFLESMATLGYAGFGYGIRYEYGMFYQRFREGMQLEQPDNWLRYGNPSEFPRPEIIYPVNFGGRVVEYVDESGHLGCHWNGTEVVIAMAYDIQMSGYGAQTVNSLRLWSAKSSREFDLEYFNQGDYLKAVENKTLSENLSKVLYPNDTTTGGRELRLRQEYFFISASIQDIVRRFMADHSNILLFPEKVAIQLNDTHPALAIVELMRLLLDRFRLPWEKAWELTTRTFSYTNHTLLPEALENWSVTLMERVLPRHLRIIYDINARFLKEVTYHYPQNVDILRRLSLVGEEGEKHIRMAHLAVVGSHKVNGVSALHTELMKAHLFSDFAHFFPDRIVNKTNGITPRLWLNQANPQLAELITKQVGNTWITQLTTLKKLEPLAKNKNFRAAFRKIKQANKEKLAHFVRYRLGIEVNPESLFDVQVKRIHEYKRQLLNLLHVITRYNRIRANPNGNYVPRTVILAGKAAHAYQIAKLTIKLVHDVAEFVNNDPLIGQRLKLVFIPNYDVTNALRIIPAADLSEQISTAGTEASGTGNMKMALNGALTIGTLDGANIEIRQAVGEENLFIFGLTAAQAQELRQSGYNPWDYYHHNEELRQVLDMLMSGYFSPGDPNRFKPITDSLLYGGDRFMILADYADYVACQNRVDELYLKPEEWAQKAIINVANMGPFSVDRTIQEYAQDIWQIKPLSDSKNATKPKVEAPTAAEPTTEVVETSATPVEMPATKIEKTEKTEKPALKSDKSAKAAKPMEEKGSKPTEKVDKANGKSAKTDTKPAPTTDTATSPPASSKPTQK